MVYTVCDTRISSPEKDVKIIGYFFKCGWYRQSAAFRLMTERQSLHHSQCNTFFGLRLIKPWKSILLTDSDVETFLEGNKKRKTRNYVFSGFGNGISRGWERKSITGRFATGRFWPCTWTISFLGKDQENSVYWKVGPLFVFVVIQRMCSSWVRRRTFRSLCGDSRSFYFHL